MKHPFRTLLILCLVFAGVVLFAPFAQATEGGQTLEVASDTTVWDEGSVYRVTGDVTIQDRVTVNGSVTLQLDAGATLTCSKGIGVYTDNTLTIQGSGTLIANASGYAQAAGIGGSYTDGHRGSGTVVINSGTVTATGGQYGAGIGGGMYGHGGSVTINGGTVTATGGKRAAGIGGGGNNNWAGNYGNAGTITINGGTVTAAGGETGAGIGSGGGATSTTSTVKGGSVTAIIIRGGQVTASSPGGAAIGPGAQGSARSITLGWTDLSDFISASTITANTIVLEDDFHYKADGTDCGEVTPENLPEKDAGYVLTPWLCPFDGEGSDGSPYLIQSADDWNALCEIFGSDMAEQGGYSGAYYRLTNSISVTRMLGTESHPFCGIFRGFQRTLTVSISDTEHDGTAPFAYVSNAAIQFLNVNGTVSGGNYCAGLVGVASGWVNIEHCNVTVAVTGSGAHCSGVVGYGTTASVRLQSTVFAGSVSGAAQIGTLLGWSDSGAYVRMYDCLDASSSTAPIGLGASTGDTDNTFYTCSGKTAGEGSPWPENRRGVLAYTVTGGEGVTVHSNCYVGVEYAQVVYASEGLSLNILAAVETELEEYVVVAVAADGGEQVLEGDYPYYSMVMPASNVTIIAREPDRDMTVSGGTGYTYSNHVLTITAAGTYTVSMSDGVTVTADRIVVSTPATVILNSVNIDTSAAGESPLYAVGRTTLQLLGSSSLTAGSGYNGIASDGGRIDIVNADGNDGAMGSLTVTGGDDAMGLPATVLVTDCSVTASGLYGAGSGFAVINNGTAYLRGGSQALQSGNIDRYGSSVTAVFVGDENGMTHFVTLSGNSGTMRVTNRYIYFLPYVAPLFRPTNAALSHLQSVGHPENYGNSWATDYEAGDSTDVLNQLAARVQYTITADYPLSFTGTGTIAMPSWELVSTDTNSFEYRIMIPSDAVLDMDLLSDAVVLTYQDTDGTVLFTEARYPGQETSLYELEDRPGLTFLGWKCNGYSVSYNQTFTQSATLTADWLVTQCYSIITESGVKAYSYISGEEITQANVGDTVYLEFVQAEIPAGKYVTGCLINGVPQGYDDFGYFKNWFDMPECDVIISPVLADSTRMVLDMTGPELAPLSDDEDWLSWIMFDLGYWGEGEFDPQEGISTWFLYDINGDDVEDFRIAYGDDGLLGCLRADGADSLTQNYEFTEPLCPMVYVLRFINDSPAFGTPDFVLPAALTEIEANAFEGVTALTVVDAHSCTHIGAEAFKGCTGLTQIRVSKNCVIDATAFDGCGIVYVFAPAGGDAEAACQLISGCEFVAVTSD